MNTASEYDSRLEVLNVEQTFTAMYRRCGTSFAGKVMQMNDVLAALVFAV